MIRADYAVRLDDAIDILESLEDIRSEAMPSHVMGVSFSDQNDAILFVLRWSPIQTDDNAWLASSDGRMSRWLTDNCPTARKQECVVMAFRHADDKVRFEQTLCERADREEGRQ